MQVRASWSGIKLISESEEEGLLLERLFDSLLEDCRDGDAIELVTPFATGLKRLNFRTNLIKLEKRGDQ